MMCVGDTAQLPGCWGQAGALGEQCGGSRTPLSRCWVWGFVCYCWSLLSAWVGNPTVARKPWASPAPAPSAGISTPAKREAKGRGGGAGFGNNKRAALASRCS